MDIRELRLGNMVQDSRDNYPCKVLCLDSERTFTFANGEVLRGSATCTQLNELDGSRGRWLKFLMPIPITEELLFKCGFSQIYGSDPQEPNAMLLYYNPTGDFTIMAMENDRSTFHYETGITVASVHQLQNLHFALTGKELEVVL